jgi:hypothetical protein
LMKTAERAEKNIHEWEVLFIPLILYIQYL